MFSFFHGTAQTWHWAKRNVAIDPFGFPVENCIDGMGNTLVLSRQTDAHMISKHDEKGRLIWKRKLFYEPGTIAANRRLCVDVAGNIYLAVASLVKIDTTPFVSPSQYGIMKLNASGRFVWWRSISTRYVATYFAPEMIANGNNIFVVLQIEGFQSLTYNGVVYSNAGNNSRCGWLARLDTAGNVQWSKRIYSPNFASCGTRDAAPEISVNSRNQLFLTGSATAKLMFETTPVIDYPYTCRHYSYGAVLNGTTGSVNWVKELPLDTLAPKANMTILERYTFSTILSNGEAVLYRSITRDTPINRFTNKLDEVSSKFYLFDANGNLKRKDSTGTAATGWHEVLQLTGGDATSFFSLGLKRLPDAEYSPFEAVKWDTTLNAVWKKSTESAISVPTFSPWKLHYRDNKLGIVMQTDDRSPSHEGFYTYFGADSLLPRNEYMFAQMLDSVSIIAGTAFFDHNQNGRKESGEPPAPGLLIADISGSAIYGVTDNRGYYEIPVSAGVYTFKLLNLQAVYPYHTIANPVQYNVTVTETGYLRNRNFAMRPSASILDGQINITPYTIARPGGILQNQVLITNPGTQTTQGSYRVIYDSSRLSYISSTQAPSAITPTQLTYNGAIVDPGDTILSYVLFAVKTTAKAGDTVRIIAELKTVPEDELLVNNLDSVVRVVVTSYDPNDKQVYPQSTANYESVLNAKQELDYTIRFQNTGNDTAFLVQIADSLDPKLDYSTFKLVASSHPVNVVWSGLGFAKFVFNNILLPDSTTNSEGSNGFVRFKIKPKANVLLSDIVSNTASIYFDYNDAIVTNTVTTSFVNSLITSIPNVSIIQDELVIWPVPIQNVLNVKLKNGIPGELLLTEIYDGAGRIVFSGRQRSSPMSAVSINVSSLTAGNYFLIVTTSGSKRYVQQMIKQ